MVRADEVRKQQRDQWDAVAAGWERRDAWFAEQTQALTEWLCGAAALAPGQRVLDLASGGGQPALTAAARVRPGGSVVATDLSPQMLAVSERRARALGLDNIELLEMDAEDLRFPDDSFDAVICRFGLMLFPGPARAAAEIQRVLRPGGRFAVAVWDEPVRNPYFTVTQRALASVVAMPAPDPKAPGVFRLAPPGELAAVLRAGGFTDVRVEALPMTLACASRAECWAIQSDLSAALRAAVATLTAPEVARLEAAVFDALAPHVEEDRVRLGAVALCATGMK